MKTPLRRAFWSWRCLPVALLVAASAVADEAPVRVLCIGPDGPVMRALRLTSATEVVADLAQADAAVVTDASAVSADAARRLGRFVRAGGGLVVFMAPNPGSGLTEELGLEEGGRTFRDDTAIVQPTDAGADLLRHINWQAAPQVRERTVLSGSGMRSLVGVYESRDIVIGDARLGAGRVFLVAAHIGAEGNRPLGEWFYFNYLTYALTVRAAGREPVDFASYPGSPVPSGAGRAAILLALAVMLGGTLAAYVWVRRYSRAHPELLRQIVRDRERYRAREGLTEWEHVGFHRAIASLMPGILNNIWAFVLISFVVNNVLYGWIMPSAQIRGALSLVTTFFGTIWTLLDWGTAMAGMKFLSQYRISEPGEGMKFVQLYVWWQAITGTLQVGVIVFVALYVLPHTSLAYLSLFVLVHALIQYPGFLAVFNSVAMPGLHRFDYPQMLAFVMSVGSPLVQVLVCSAAVVWGRSNPVYDCVAGGLGVGVAGLVAGFVSFGISFWLYQRLGLSAKVVFLAHFDRRTVITALKFGAPIMAAGLLYTGAYSIQVMILSHLVLNYAEVQANFDVVCSVGMSGLVFPFLAVGVLTGSLTNSFSEAYAAGKMKLCRYYVTMSIKWGQVVCAFLMAVLLAVGDRYILGALGDQYERASVWIRWFSVWAFLAAVVWTSDSALVGIGKPGLSFVAMVAEQGVRILLMFLLASRLQAFSLVAAYMVALPIKGLVSLIFVHRHMKGIVVNWWQALFSPLLSAGVIYFLLRGFGSLFWSQDSSWFSVTLLAVGLIGAMPPYFFLTGLFGAWDRNGLEEFRRAVPMSSVGRPLASVLLRSTEWGSRLSPLYDRFPTTTYAEAMIEADELTRLKVPLDEYADGLLPLASPPSLPAAADADPSMQPAQAGSAGDGP